MKIIKPKTEYLKKIKINRFLSSEGVCSRSEAEQLAQEGFLFVNNIVVSDVEKRIDPQIDIVSIKEFVKPVKDLLIIMNKPQGIVSQIMKSDVRPANSLLKLDSYATYIKGKHSEASKIVKNKTQFYPLGSLEKEAAGLLVLTNHKNLIRKLTNFEIYLEREFLVKLDKPLHRKWLDQIYKGTLMHGYLIKPFRVKLEASDLLRLTLHTDYKNQIYQLLAKAGVKPLEIECVRIGAFSLGSLKPGQWLVVDQQKDIIKK